MDLNRKHEVHIESLEEWGDDPKHEHDRYHDAIDAMEEGLTVDEYRRRSGAAE